MVEKMKISPETEAAIIADLSECLKLMAAETLQRVEEEKLDFAQEFTGEFWNGKRVCHLLRLVQVAAAMKKLDLLEEESLEPTARETAEEDIAIIQNFLSRSRS